MCMHVVEVVWACARDCEWLDGVYYRDPVTVHVLSQTTQCTPYAPLDVLLGRLRAQTSGCI